MLIGDRTTLVEVDTERPELGLDVATREPGDEPAAGEYVEGGEGLREQHGIVMRQDQDTRAEPEATREAGDAGEAHQGIEEWRLRRRGDGIVPDRHRHVLAGPHRLEAHLFGGLRHAPLQLRIAAAREVDPEETEAHAADA